MSPNAATIRNNGFRAFGVSLQKDNYFNSTFIRHPYHRLDTPSSGDDDCGDVELKGGGGGRSAADAGRSAAAATAAAAGDENDIRTDPSSSSIEDSEDDDGRDGDYDPLLEDDAAVWSTRSVKIPNSREQPRVFPWRWVQLSYLSLLALLSDWVCFSTASVPRSFASVYPGRTSEGLIDLFLLTNVLGCIVVTDAVSRFGLKRCVRAMSVLMMVGCWLRIGLGIFPASCDALGIRHHVVASSLLDNSIRASDGRPVFGLPTYPWMAAGTVLVGFAQPFFQCTPPLLSATWFASNERATSSAIALNFNQVGIAAALVVGGWMVVDEDGSEYDDDNDDDDEMIDAEYREIDRYHRMEDEHGIVDPVLSGVAMRTRTTRGEVDDGSSQSYPPPYHRAGGDDIGLLRYLALVAVLSTILCAGTCRHFRDSPPVPPSASEMGKMNQHVPPAPFHVSVRGFLSKRGFGSPLAAFVYSIAITNVVGAFIEEVMERGGVTDRREIAWAGCGFEMAIVLGGIILGRYVDRTKKYKSVTMWCIALSLVFILPLGLTQHRLGQEPKLLVASLLLLGFFVGPVQPINAELAVDVTFPGDETAVESVQQFGGNLVSAMLVPVVGRAAKLDYQLLPSVPLLASDIRGDVVFMMALSIATFCYYRSFDAPLRRSMADGS
ncbi:hypothetical protein ACHAXA_010018 [Cyclostephanos tholiformis]|uniref:Uncharacterized protein n=1 Tax=Cyclostephanos tholiformis TaxID=382380 RepID=A0ABD3RJX6_9STRA